MGLKPSDDELRSILSEIDLMYHGQMELQDYLQVDGSRQSAVGWGQCPSRAICVVMGSGPGNWRFALAIMLISRNLQSNDVVKIHPKSKIFRGVTYPCPRPPLLIAT